MNNTVFAPARSRSAARRDLVAYLDPGRGALGTLADQDRSHAGPRGR